GVALRYRWPNTEPYLRNLHLAANEADAFGDFLRRITALLELDGAEPLEAAAADRVEELRHITLALPHDDAVPGRILVLEVDDAHVRLQLPVGVCRIDTHGDHVAGVERGEQIRMPLQRRLHILRRLVKEFAVGEVMVVDAKGKPGLTAGAVDFIQQL